MKQKWQSRKCSSSGKIFYEDEETGERGWFKKGSADGDKNWDDQVDDRGYQYFENKKTKEKTFAAPVIDKESANKKGEEWTVVHDDEHDADYYVNNRTRKTTWNDRRGHDIV